MASKRSATLVTHKFKEFLLPTIFTSMAMSLASVVDGVIVGNLLGEKALAATGLASPVLLALNAFFFLFSVGGIVCASRARGERNIELSNTIFTLSILGGFVVSTLYALGATVFSEPLAMELAHGDAELAKMTQSYITSVIWAAPFLTVSLTLSQFWKSDGSPNASMLTSLIANGVNLILDYVLIRFLNAGIMGAGLSTTLGYFIGTAITLKYLFSKKRSFHFVKVTLQRLRKLVLIVQSGMYRALQSLSTVAQTLVINVLIISIYGSIGMTAMTICINAQMIALIFSGGICETFLPIVGALSGEKDYYGIRATLKRAITTLVILILCATAFFLAAPQVISGLFGVKGAEAQEMTAYALRLYALSLPICTLNQLLQNYYGAIGQKKLASAIPIVNNFVILICYALLLFKINGELIWLSYLFAEATTLVLIFAAARFVRKKHKELHGIFLMPHENKQQNWSATIRASAKSATTLSQEAIDFCDAQGVNGRLANFLGLCIEECCINTEQMNDKKGVNIDALVAIDPNEIVLRLRDDGVFFNPTVYSEADDMPHERIDLVKKIAKSMEYSHYLGFNTTIITLANRESEGE